MTFIVFSGYYLCICLNGIYIITMYTTNEKEFIYIDTYIQNRSICNKYIA